MRVIEVARVTVMENYNVESQTFGMLLQPLSFRQ